MCLAIPGKVLEINGDDNLTRTAKVDFNGIIKEIHLGYVPNAKINDWVNVHAGFAITVLEEQDAQEILGIFEEFARHDRETL